MYFEFLLRRAHSRSRVERRYWSGVSLYSFTTSSNDVTVGTTGPIGSGLPQFGFPRRFAISTRGSFPCGVRRRKHFSLACFSRKLAVSAGDPPFVSVQKYLRRILWNRHGRGRFRV